MIRRESGLDWMLSLYSYKRGDWWIFYIIYVPGPIDVTLELFRLLLHYKEIQGRHLGSHGKSVRLGTY